MSFLLTMTAAVALGAAPPPHSGDTSQTIVVEGIRDQRKPANDYLDKVIPPVFDAQLGRFEDRLCPSAIGLPANLKGEVMARMRQVAAAAGVPTASGNCTSNLLLIVVDDKKAVIEGMRREKQAYLYGIGKDRVKRLESSPAPVAAWQITDVIGADGMPLRMDGDGFRACSRPYRRRAFGRRPAAGVGGGGHRRNQSARRRHDPAIGGLRIGSRSGSDTI